MFHRVGSAPLALHVVFDIHTAFLLTTPDMYYVQSGSKLNKQLFLSDE